MDLDPCKRKNGISTRILAAYIPCRARKSSLLSTYAQHTRFWRLKGENQCARSKARNDFLQFICVTKVAEDRVILMLDGNKSMLQGKLARELRGEEYGMKDAIQDRVDNKNSRRDTEARNR